MEHTDLIHKEGQVNKDQVKRVRVRQTITVEGKDKDRCDT